MKINLPVSQREVAVGPRANILSTTDLKGVITYVNPAVAVAAGALVLDEPVTPWTLMAFVLILAGSFLSTRASPSPAQ